MNGNTYYAVGDPRSADFMRELRKLYQKHGLCIVPTFQGEVSFHDSMRVIRYDVGAKKFLEQTSIAETLETE